MRNVIHCGCCFTVGKTTNPLKLSQNSRQIVCWDLRTRDKEERNKRLITKGLSSIRDRFVGTCRRHISCFCCLNKSGQPDNLGTLYCIQRRWIVKPKTYFTSVKLTDSRFNNFCDKKCVSLKTSDFSILQIKST